MENKIDRKERKRVGKKRAANKFELCGDQNKRGLGERGAEEAKSGGKGERGK